MGETPATRWALEVEGMTCDACERHVAHAVERAGGADVSASWRDGTAVFAAGNVDEATLAAAVDEAGYTAGTLRRLEGADQVSAAARRAGSETATLLRRDAAAPGPGADGRSDWDLAIIGSGSAAFAAAIKAREAGARVVMIEKGTPGGTCVNTGCVPSKAVLAAADVYHRARHHDFAGVPRLDGAAPDLTAIVAQKDELVASMRQGKYLDLVDDYGFILRRGTARFVDHETIEVDGEPLVAANYLIATGSHPARPPIAGLDQVDYLTSTTALELDELPRRLAVIGANAIGLELGQAFGHLGAEVTFLDIAERIAPFEEPEVSATLTDVLVGEGAQVVTGARIERVDRHDDGVVLRGRWGGADAVLEVDRVLVATGRAATTAELNLAAAGVAVDERGFVVADGFRATANRRVWAAGDVTGSPQFVYVSAYEGALVADNAISGIGRSIDYRTLPRVTFTSPQAAAVGLTEAEAAQAGHEVVTSLLPLEHVPRALVSRDTRGVVKLVADGASGRLLGVHVVAEGAGDVIQAGVYALLAKLTTAEVAGAFHPYLTMAEGLKLAAQTFTRDVSKLSCCAA